VRMINKGAEPNSLTQHRAQKHSDYDNYAQKDELRIALVGEQKGLCCYCTARIRAEPTTMKIEHWQSQSTCPNRQLAYGNLLGACLGGEGKSPPEQHCDTRKGNRDLKWNPANLAHAIETRLFYLVDGTVVGSDAEFDTQLNDVLGLNLSYLKSNRKAVLDSVLEWWRGAQPVPVAKVQSEIDRRTSGDAEYLPFSPVAVWFLRKKLMGAVQ